MYLVSRAIMRKTNKLWLTIKDEDKISHLPDEILCTILSYLEAKQAARTCIMSKRWKHIWTKLHILKFNKGYNLSDPNYSPKGKNTSFS